MKQIPFPIVTIIGEPNVGKSTLLNTIAKKHIAITSKVPGTTRDRQYFDTQWNKATFTLVDTAGLTFNDENKDLENSLHKQAQIAIDEADIILWVIDGKLPIESIDQRIVNIMRKTQKPIVLFVNKLDSPHDKSSTLPAFYKLGFKDIAPVSAISKRGLGDGLDLISNIVLKHHEENQELIDFDGNRVAFVGKPNVGKSSLINYILNEERVIVSDIPGTTRSSIDTYTTIDDKEYCFIDTAGLKKKLHRQSQPEIYSSFQTFKSVRRSDVAILILSAVDEITKQDQNILGEVLDMKRGVIIAVNKIDEYNGDPNELTDYIRHHLPFAWFAPIIFISAKTGEGVMTLLKLIPEILDVRKKVSHQDEINRLLAYTLEKNPPRLMRDQKAPKVFGLNQIDVNPPLFELIVNKTGAISKMYRDYLKKQIIQKLGYQGTDIKIKLIEK